MNFIMHICIHTQSIILRPEPYIRLTINFFSEKSKCGINVMKKKNMYATINHQVLHPETQYIYFQIFWRHSRLYANLQKKYRYNTKCDHMQRQPKYCNCFSLGPLFKRILVFKEEIILSLKFLAVTRQNFMKDSFLLDFGNWILVGIHF